MLARVGSIAGFGALAGCIDGVGSTDGNGDESDTDDNRTTGDDEDTATGPVADATIETLEAKCGSTSGATIDADLEVEPGTATISGSVRAPNPCHEAVVAGTVVESGALTVTIGVESGGEDICMGCTGQVEYEATITLGRRPPTVLAVGHEHLEETKEVARRDLDG